MVKCPECDCEKISYADDFCPGCGATLRESCPVCHAMHPTATKFCPQRGNNIADYKVEVERKKEVEKEFDGIFEKTYRKECLKARFKAFFVSLLCYEAVLAMIISIVGRILSSDEVLNSSVSIFLAVFFLVVTFASTGVSYENKREEILDAYLTEKILGEKIN
jgi:hypothetical protein